MPTVMQDSTRGARGKSRSTAATSKPKKRGAKSGMTAADLRAAVAKRAKNRVLPGKKKAAKRGPAMTKKTPMEREKAAKTKPVMGRKKARNKAIGAAYKGQSSKKAVKRAALKAYARGEGAKQAIKTARRVVRARKAREGK